MTANLGSLIWRLTVKIFRFWRLTVDFLAIWRLPVNPIETLFFWKICRVAYTFRESYQVIPWVLEELFSRSLGPWKKIPVERTNKTVRQFSLCWSGCAPVVSLGHCLQGWHKLNKKSRRRTNNWNAEGERWSWNAEGTSQNLDDNLREERKLLLVYQFIRFLNGKEVFTYCAFQ